MINKQTDFFKVFNNFEKTLQIKSILISESKLKNFPKVTIAIPTFKRFELLKEALDSAINQLNYLDYDILIVDNDPERGCDTERLLEKYNVPNLSYYKNAENLGMAGNWNRLFSLAKGEFVVMLHDDDLLLPQFLDKSMRIISQNDNIHLLKPKFYIFERTLKQNEVSKLKKLNEKIAVINTFSFYSGCIVGSPTGAIFKKESVFKLGGFNSDFYPSLDFCFYVLFSKYYPIHSLNEYLVLYRIFENESFKSETMHGFIKTDYYLIRFILKHYKVPEFIILNYLTFISLNRINYVKKELDPKFKFDFNSIELKDANLFMANFSSKILKICDLSIQMFNYFKVHLFGHKLRKG